MLGRGGIHTEQSMEFFAGIIVFLRENREPPITCKMSQSGGILVWSIAGRSLDKQGPAKVSLPRKVCSHWTCRCKLRKTERTQAMMEDPSDRKPLRPLGAEDRELGRSCTTYIPRAGTDGQQDKENRAPVEEECGFAGAASTPTWKFHARTRGDGD